MNVYEVTLRIETPDIPTVDGLPRVVSQSALLGELIAKVLPTWACTVVEVRPVEPETWVLCGATIAGEGSLSCDREAHFEGLHSNGKVTWNYDGREDEA